MDVCLGSVCSRGQRSGGEGLSGGDEVYSGQQLHPTGEAQPRRGGDVPNPNRSYPHPDIIAEAGGTRSFLIFKHSCHQSVQVVFIPYPI